MTVSTKITLSPLGKAQSYASLYQPDLLFSIPRQLHRNEIGIKEGINLPFKGVDIWNAFEISWLNSKGKPIVALGEFIFPCESLNLIESKSFKLYLNSFNNTKFDSVETVTTTLIRDLSAAAGASVGVKVIPLDSYTPPLFQIFSGICLDKLDITCDSYELDVSYLKTQNDQIVTEELYSDLLKSNCLVTGQPDWASIQMSYTGKKIDREGLLKYLISFRNHNEFHEQCVERVFMDIMQHCMPLKLTVEARYTRRGGLDINPFRSTEQKGVPVNRPVPRQ